MITKVIVILKVISDIDNTDITTSTILQLLLYYTTTTTIIITTSYYKCLNCISEAGEAV